MRVNTFFDFCDQIFCTFSAIHLRYTIFLYILLKLTPVYSSCFLSVQAFMDISIRTVCTRHVQVVLTLFMIQSSNLLIHIPEGKLTAHNTRHCAHLSTHKGPCALIDQCMPSGDIDPRYPNHVPIIPWSHSTQSRLCRLKESHILSFYTKYKYLSMVVDIVESEYILECRWISKYYYPILISIEVISVCQYVTCYRSIIGIEESGTLWNWRRNHFDNPSIRCRSYMFMEMMH